MTDLITPKATDSLEAWLSYLEKSHFKPIDMGLERISGVARQLDLLKPAPYVITVAGTNGKGSTCKMLETALLKSGLRVGVYSSPHLFCYNERVRIQGETLPDAAHTRSFADISEKKQVSLTYFEYSTLSALQLFKQAKLDVVILEVGLGGRLDATNIVDADLSVITSIDIDHTAFLGDNRELIGREKAGIFRHGKTAIVGEPDCPQSILDYAAEVGAPLYRVGQDWHYRLNDTQWQWQGFGKSFSNLPLPQIPLQNAATALAALHCLPFALSDEVIRATLTETVLTGRFQHLTAQDFAKFSGKRPLAQVVVDVGHNPHAARYLASRLHALKQNGQRIFALFSALEDKDLAGIVDPLDAFIDEWHCAGLDVFRGQSGAEVAKRLHNALPDAVVYTYPTVAAAAELLFEKAAEKDMILVFGSFHTVADFMQWIEK